MIFLLSICCLFISASSGHQEIVDRFSNGFSFNPSLVNQIENLSQLTANELEHLIKYYETKVFKDVIETNGHVSTFILNSKFNEFYTSILKH